MNGIKGEPGVKRAGMQVKASIIASIVAVIAAGVLFGCASGGSAADSSSNDSTVSAESQADFSFAMDADCVACHTKEASSVEHTLYSNSNHASIACTTCHADEKGLTTAHTGVKVGDTTPKRLKKTTVDDAACLSCHGSYEDLAAKTKDCTALTDKEGTVVNPHEAKALNADHEEALGCASCHEMHSTDSAADSAYKSCTSCHHAEVYACYTCHD